MSKKKKSEPFDNSISAIPHVICCPNCELPLLFMYARKITEDELFLCKNCQTVYCVKMKFKIITTKHKDL